MSITTQLSAIKFIPNYADQGDHIRLKASWCNGGKARTVPINLETAVGRKKAVQDIDVIGGG